MKRCTVLVAALALAMMFGLSCNEKTGVEQGDGTGAVEDSTPAAPVNAQMQAAKCIMNLEIIRVALFKYQYDKRREAVRYPASLDVLYPVYVKNKKNLYMPGTGRKLVYCGETPALGSRRPICWSPGGVLEKRLVFREGGIIKEMAEAEFQKLMKKCRLDPETGKLRAAKKSGN